MTINDAFKLAIYIAGGITGIYVFFEKLIKPQLNKLKEYKEKINRGAKLDDDYEKDHEIILEMASTIKNIDQKLTKQDELLEQDYMLTLRNTIMNDNLTFEERYEAYLDYKKRGGNGKVKAYAEKHLIKKEGNV